MITFEIILTGNLSHLVHSARVQRRLPAVTTVKDALEAMGIPHVEIGAVTLDGHQATIDHLIQDQMTLIAHPVAPMPVAAPSFICDVHLGKLARLLRFCGFDTVWNRTWREETLARLASREDRLLLSRHRALLKRKTIKNGMLIRSGDADQQLIEVLRRFRITDRINRPGRCASCNGVLQFTPRDQVSTPIPPLTAAWRDEYWVCRQCGHLFWNGTHVEHLNNRVETAIHHADRDD